MPPVNVLIKPASSSCNMRCSYCFYHDEAKNRSTDSFGLMQRETLEAVMHKALAHASGSCTFGFQGGEPTLAGLDFFKTAILLQKQHNVKKLPIQNTIQTNGLLIDDEWAAFFVQNHFLVGVSLDGYEDLHDLHRRDVTENGTFSKVMQGIETLKHHNVEFNILAVVTSETARNVREAYRFFFQSGLVYHQYIPCMDPLGSMPGQQSRSLTPELYARFLKKLFDLWYKDRTEGRFVYIRYFENLAGILLGHNAESCDMNGRCSVQYAIEADGSVYPCDFYMLDGDCIGNINADSMETIDRNRACLGFIQQSLPLPEQCRTCEWLRICRGGCKRYREQEADLHPGVNRFCGAYKEAFPYILPRLERLLNR